MRVEQDWDYQRECDQCLTREYLYTVILQDGTVMCRLCKKCLLELLKAIVERS